MIPVSVILVLILCSPNIRTQDAEESDTDYGNEPPPQSTRDELGLMAMLNQYAFDHVREWVLWVARYANEVGEYVTGVWTKMEKIMDQIIAYVRKEDCYFVCPRGA